MSYLFTQNGKCIADPHEVQRALELEIEPICAPSIEICTKLDAPAARTRSSAATASARAQETAAMFGIDVDGEAEGAIVPSCRIQLPNPGIVFITGPSGAGKSTLLRAIGAQCVSRGVQVIGLDDLPQDQGDHRVIDLVGDSLDESMSLLSLAGLSEAFVMLRRPHELSDGQRYRFALARMMHAASRHERCVVLADEFGAALDRLTAKIIARNLRRWIDRSDTPRIAFVAATSHDDLLESIQPDVLVWISMGGDIQVHRRSQ
jgi:hypothetical protein